MANPSTYIKLDRNILNWEWYQNANTFRVFIHLLLKAQIKDETYQGVKIKRGDVVTSYGSLAKSLMITISQARTTINHLQMTGEIAIKRHPKFLVISILKYNLYQDKSQSKSQSNRTQIAIKIADESQHLKNIKNNKKECFPNGETLSERKARLEELRNQ